MREGFEMQPGSPEPAVPEAQTEATVQSEPAVNKPEPAVAAAAENTTAESAGEESPGERWAKLNERYDTLFAQFTALKKKDRSLVYEWYSLRDGRRLRILIFIAIFCIGLTCGSWLHGLV